MFCISDVCAAFMMVWKCIGCCLNEFVVIVRVNSEGNLIISPKQVELA